MQTDTFHLTSVDALPGEPHEVSHPSSTSTDPTSSPAKHDGQLDRSVSNLQQVLHAEPQAHTTIAGKTMKSKRKSVECHQSSSPSAMHKTPSTIDGESSIHRNTPCCSPVLHNRMLLRLVQRGAGISAACSGPLHRQRFLRKNTRNTASNTSPTSLPSQWLLGDTAVTSSNAEPSAMIRGDRLTDGKDRESQECERRTTAQRSRMDDPHRCP